MMRRALLLFGVVSVVALPWFPAAAQTPNTPPPSSSSRAPPPQACPPGTHWEEAGYVGHGKWREARCARDNGRE